ncbi:MAG: 2-amino-4-hydroxy-6-hydroxymethyldihydropteridine diphosphokinase [Candidatus Omnitrophica bacterium]|nr:2-amino-4-hydroxy-6-hydroxymethyldihydropteridine diphosphokinase [Candidatus Omnitrophota bacterium]
MTLVYLGLGSNIGNRRENIKRALSLLNKDGLKIREVSKLIETEPVGLRQQRKFLNAVACLSTELSPIKLLRKVKRIEKEMGRKSSVRFGPRIIDLDILIYGNLKLKSKELTIPHPRMHKRDFVLKPLSSLTKLSHLRIKNKK